MLKVLILLFGAGAGATGATAWLLSDPETRPASPSAIAPGIGDRWRDLMSRLDEALAEGKRAGAETESRLRGQLNDYRRPPAST